MDSDLLIFWTVVAGRLLLPLLIFRFPVVGIFICLVLDGVDQTIFQTFTDLNLDGYQSYDKALDVYYLSLAYIATMRNWDNGGARTVAQFLYFYRLVGVTVFELAPGDDRWLLLVFPNTFEYFFIFYELVRTRWRTRDLSMRFWVTAAAAIWVVVKLPQEYWIHVAQLDVTDLVRAHPAQAGLLAIAVAALAALAYPVLRRRTPAADHAMALAAGPLPEEMDELDERLSFRVGHGRVFDRWLLEKIVLIALVSTIFAQILPGVNATPVQITLSVAIVVTANSVFGLFTARRGWGVESALGSFLALTAFNVAFVTVVRTLQGDRRNFDAVDGIFFLLLLTLIVSTYDRYRPVVQARIGLLPGVAEPRA